MRAIQGLTRYSLGCAGRSAFAGVLLGAAGLLITPASADGLSAGQGTGIGVGASVGAGNAGVGADADLATSASISRTTSSSSDEEEASGSAATANAATETSTSAAAMANKSDNEGTLPVAIIDASIAADAAAATDVTVHYPTSTRATK